MSMLKQVLVISVKDTELTAVMPVNDDGTIHIAGIAHTAVELFNDYLDGFTSLNEFEAKALACDMANYHRAIFHSISEFSQNSNQCKQHIMCKLKDIQGTEHNFCLCFLRVNLTHHYPNQPL